MSYPIYVDASEIVLMTSETKRQILVHNEIWALKCSDETYPTK